MIKQSAKKSTQRQTSKKAKIMIVDDEGDIAEMLSRSLQQHGFEVRFFTNPQKALSEFNTSYDLLLLDVRMPGLSGFELYHEIRKTGAKVTVCFLTAFEEYHDNLKSQFPELDEIKCYIKKPIATGELVRKIETLLRSRQ